MFSATSFGVFCREAPSTRAIIRSMNVSPGFDVMRTTIWSDRTLVPPVTAERSPPDSRMTGADSPVMADSSTEGMPSTTSPPRGLPLSGALGDRLGQVGEQDGEPEPGGDRPGEDRRLDDRVVDGQHRADLDHEHDRVLNLDPRVQLEERVRQRLPEHVRVEETAADTTPRSNEILGGQRGIRTRCLW